MITFTIDTSEFNRALHELARNSSRDYPVIVNSEAFNLANEAIKQTRRVDKAKIPTEPQWQPPAVYRTINAWRRQHGWKPVKRGQWAEVIEKHIKARQKSCNYVRSGWLAAMAALWPAMKGTGPNAPKFRRSRSIARLSKDLGKGDQGWAVPAHGAVFMKVATIGSFSTKNPGIYSFRPGNPEKYIEEGLVKAVAARVADMRDTVEKKLRGDIEGLRAKRLGQFSAQSRKRWFKSAAGYIGPIGRKTA